MDCQATLSISVTQCDPTSATTPLHWPAPTTVKDYLTLLQCFLNHRQYLRSEDPSRVGKSPAELLTGERHAHWLELLGYNRFSRS